MNAKRIFSIASLLVALGMTATVPAAEAQVSGASEQVNAQTGTTYTFNCYPPDAGKLVTFSNASAVAVTLPQAGHTCFPAGWWADVTNLGAGTVTVTPGTSTINGASSYTVATGAGVRLVSDGTNYQVQPGGAATSNAVLPAAQGGTGTNFYTGLNLVTNGSFGLDQEYAGSGPTPSSSTAIRVADRWFTQWVVSTSGAGNPTVSQAAAATGMTIVPKELKITANSSAGTTTPAALNFIVYQSIEGNDVAFLGEGTAGAATATVSVYVKASVAGTYDLFVQNGAGNQSYVSDCTVVAATATRCAVVVPGDTSGTWSRTRDSIGMVVGVTAACGSTFQTTGNAWQSGTYNCTSNQTALTNNASATLEITAVKVEPGSYATAYVDDAAAVLLAKAERFYRKSFLQGVAPAQNVGTGNGEACYQNPIANGEGSITVAYPQMYNGSVTLTTYNPGAANANFRDETGSADVTIGTPIANTTNLFLPTGATVSTIAHKVCVNYTVDEGF